MAIGWAGRGSSLAMAVPLGVPGMVRGVVAAPCGIWPGAVAPVVLVPVVFGPVVGVVAMGGDCGTGAVAPVAFEPVVLAPVVGVVGLVWAKAIAAPSASSASLDISFPSFHSACRSDSSERPAYNCAIGINGNRLNWSDAKKQ
jgi:hypothetical protein